MRPIATHVAHYMVCVLECAKNGWTNCEPVWWADFRRPKESRIKCRCTMAPPNEWTNTLFPAAMRPYVKLLVLKWTINLTFIASWSVAWCCCITRTLFVAAIDVFVQLIAVCKLLTTVLTCNTFHSASRFLGCWSWQQFHIWQLMIQWQTTNKYIQYTPQHVSWWCNMVYNLVSTKQCWCFMWGNCKSSMTTLVDVIYKWHTQCVIPINTRPYTWVH